MEPLVQKVVDVGAMNASGNLWCKKVVDAGWKPWCKKVVDASWNSWCRKWWMQVGAESSGCKLETLVQVGVVNASWNPRCNMR